MLPLSLILFAFFGLNGAQSGGCDEGFYGPLCLLTCGQCSGNETCNDVTGECMMGCEVGWKAPLCNMPCTDNMYGQNCSTKCGNCYNGQQCNHITGDCLNGCITGFTGENCSFDNTPIVLLIRAVIIAGAIAGGIYIIVMTFCTVMCVRSRRRKKREMYLDDNQDDMEDDNSPPVQMRRGTGRDGIFMTHLNSLMNFGQTPKGKRRVIDDATFRPVSRDNYLYATSGPSWRDSEFSVLSDNNYVNMKTSVRPPRTSGGMIYANGILIDQSSAPPQGSYGDILNQYANVRLKNSQDEPPPYSDAIYQNSETTHV